MNKFNWKFNRRVVINMYNRIFFMILLEKKNLMFEIVKVFKLFIITPTLSKKKKI